MVWKKYYNANTKNNRKMYEIVYKCKANTSEYTNSLE